MRSNKEIRTQIPENVLFALYTLKVFVETTSGDIDIQMQQLDGDTTIQINILDTLEEIPDVFDSWTRKCANCQEDLNILEDQIFQIECNHFVHLACAAEEWINDFKCEICKDGNPVSKKPRLPTKKVKKSKRHTRKERPSIINKSIECATTKENDPDIGTSRPPLQRKTAQRVDSDAEMEIDDNENDSSPDSTLTIGLSTESGINILNETELVKNIVTKIYEAMRRIQTSRNDKITNNKKLQIHVQANNLKSLDGSIDEAEKICNYAQSQVILCWFLIGKCIDEISNEFDAPKDKNSLQQYITKRYREITGRQNVKNRIHRSKIIYMTLNGLSEDEILAFNNIYPFTLYNLTIPTAKHINELIIKLKPSI